MDTGECLECDILWAAYRRATRKELDLTIQFDQADILNNGPRREELRALLGAVAVARARASQSVLDHEDRHIARWKLNQEGSGPLANCSFS
jgi:hypothetical protein